MRRTFPIISKLMRLSSVALLSLLVGAVIQPCFAQGAPQTLQHMRACPVSLSPVRAQALVRPLVKESEAQSITTAAVFRVPVYVHVLQDSAGTNTVTEGNIRKTIQRLNRGFKKAGFVFRIKGIQTVVNDSWAHISDPNDSVTDDIPRALKMGPPTAANIFVTDLDNLCGFANLPYDESPLESMFLNPVCMVGGSGVGNFDTIIHEMGHFMGLLHTFAPEPDGCQSPGDEIPDTPYQKEYHFECGPFDTCPNLRGRDPTNNFMDYSEDKCKHIFTRSQIAVMRLAHKRYRIDG